MLTMLHKKLITVKWFRLMVYISMVILLVTLYSLNTDNYNDTEFGERDRMNSSGFESVKHEAIQDSKPKILIVVSDKIGYSAAVSELQATTKFLRAKHEIRWSNDWSGTALFEDLGAERIFDLVVIANFYSYNQLADADKTLLKSYCVQHSVGMLILHWSSVLSVDETVDISPITNQDIGEISSYRINPNKSLWRITKDFGLVVHGLKNTFSWVAFDVPVAQGSAYEPIAEARVNNGTTSYAVGYVDNGEKDGIRKVVLGNSLSFWFHHSIILDAMHMLTRGLISLPLKRTVIIDIDDIFLGTHHKMNESDTQELLFLQNRMKKYIRNFKFNLAFSGTGYKKGSETQIKGDIFLTKHKDEFNWFPHTYHHVKAHTIPTLELLEQEMIENKQFAKKIGLKAMPHYSISPSHSGVYPIIEPLYTAWRRIWDIRVTSTTNYYEPLAFNRLHFGFTHSGIEVLPRDSLNIYSQYWSWSDVKGGKVAIDGGIKGGSIYLRYLYNPLMIAMTHAPNFGTERVANYAIENTFQFLSRWTNLEFVNEDPVQASKEYFDMYPEERNLYLENPCLLKLQFLYENADRCKRNPIPDFLVLGPQKTGTTALMSFLKMHPLLTTNNDLADTYEETQFFSSEDHYRKGVEWYMDLFPNRESANTLLFEKSATYFSNKRVPQRAFALLPNAKLIVILAEPGQRAYSFYQHMRAHDDKDALTHTFHDLLVSVMDNTNAYNLRSHILHPGKYATCIKLWLQFYPLKQMLFIDGDRLRDDPISIMKEVQDFLKVKVHDYSTLLRFDKEKGFFCGIDHSSDTTKCLGSGKGRSLSYPPMTAADEHLMKTFYKPHNVELYKLLKTHHIPVPTWLEKDVETH